MAVRWSRLHAQLGEAPGDLTYGHVAAAVSQQMPEAADLDWKAALPGKEEPQLDEFAKDIAAMANTGGGLIVYGVEEQRGTGRAAAVGNVDNSEGTQRRLRMLAASRIHPAVVGLDLVPLDSDDGQHSVLVLSVPRSPDAPHVIGQGSKLGVPFRSGPETQWMRERDLERAYADRFARREDEHTRLVSMADEISDQLNRDQSAWIVAVARPRTPLATVSGPPTVSDIRTVFEAVLVRSVEIAPTETMGRYLPVRDLDQAALNPRVGLRRWISQTIASDGSDDRSNSAHVELHHDGSVGFAIALEGWYEPVLTEQHQIPTALVESFAADFVALAETYARHLGEQVPLSFWLDLRRADAGRPFAAIDVERYGGFVTANMARVRGSRTVRRFVPVAGEIPVTADIDALREVTRRAAEDVLHQFGVARLSVLK